MRFDVFYSSPEASALYHDALSLPYITFSFILSAFTVDTDDDATSFGASFGAPRDQRAYAPITRWFTLLLLTPDDLSLHSTMLPYSTRHPLSIGRYVRSSSASRSAGQASSWHDNTMNFTLSSELISISICLFPVSLV